MAFTRAERQKVFLKVAITGPSGSGKTYGALMIAFGLGDKIAMLDTENGSGSLYAHLGEYDTDVIGAPYTVQRYTACIEAAVKGGYDVLIIDSLTHLWAADGGLLAQKEAKDSRGGNSYTNWAEITKDYERFKSVLLQSPIHIIATMRSKQDYVIEQGQNGKSAPKKVGMAPVMRDGIEYEFTTVFDVAMTHAALTSKDRTGLFDGEDRPLSAEHGLRLKQWRESASAPQGPPSNPTVADTNTRPVHQEPSAPVASPADKAPDRLTIAANNACAAAIRDAKSAGLDIAPFRSWDGVPYAELTGNEYYALAESVRAAIAKHEEEIQAKSALVVTWPEENTPAIPVLYDPDEDPFADPDEEIAPSEPLTMRTAAAAAGFEITCAECGGSLSDEDKKIHAIIGKRTPPKCGNCRNAKKK